VNKEQEPIDLAAIEKMAASVAEHHRHHHRGSIYGQEYEFHVRAERLLSVGVPAVLARVRHMERAIVGMWERAALTEGQAAQALGVDRLTAREIRDRILDPGPSSDRKRDSTTPEAP